MGLTLCLLRLKAAKDAAAASMSVEAAAALMTPEETLRLSRVRNIGIAVRWGEQVLLMG